MVKISVDLGYAYDFLSILEVKFLQSEQEAAIKYFNFTFNELEQAVGVEKHLKIYRSDEYDALFKINHKIFDLVDLAKTNSCTAKEVDDANYERFKIKKLILAKFPEEINQFSESKINY